MLKKGYLSTFAVLFSGAVLVNSCVIDTDYAVNDISKDLDTEMTLFGGGVEVPIGKSEQIYLSDVMKMANDTSLKNFLKADDQGRYAVSVAGNYDLSDVIGKMELDKLINLDGAAFSQSIEYNLGNFSKDQFTITGRNFNYNLPGFEPFDLDNVKIPEVSCPDQVIRTELYKYRPEGLNIGEKIRPFNVDENLFHILDIKDRVSEIPIGGDEETPLIQGILEALGFASLSFSGDQQVVNGAIGLGEKASSIADVRNFKLQSGGKVTVSLSVTNCPLTGGTITPNIKANISNMLNLDDADILTGDIDLSELVLTADRDWSAKKVYFINSLAQGFPTKNGDKIDICGSVDLKSGSIDISGAKSTKNKVASMASKTMGIKLSVSVEEVLLESMDIEMGNNVNFEFEPVEIPVDFSFDLPKEVKKVDEVSLDQTNPMLLEISASNLSGVKCDDGHLSLKPEIEITFPEGLEVQEAVNHKLTVTGDLYNGKISRQIHVLSLTPAPVDGKVSFSGSVKAAIKARAEGCFNSKNLPKDAASDVVLTGKITYSPKISGYNATLDIDKLKQTFNKREEFSFELEDIGDFGEFEIYPKTACSARVEIAIPDLTDLNIIADNVVVSLPDIMVVDGSGISGYNPVNNTITLNGEIPSLIEVPIKYLKIKPTTEPGGTTRVTGYFTIDGTITVDRPSITDVSVKELSSSQPKLDMVIPTIEAGRMSLVGDFSKSLDYPCKDVVFLDKNTVSKLPKEVKELNEIEFESVNAIVQITLDGLPNLSNGNYFHLQNTSVVLPDFLVAHDGSNTIVFDKDIRVSNNNAIITKAVLGGIRNVNLSGIQELKGDITFKSTLYSEKPDVDLNSLKNKIVGTVKVAVGDGTGILDPGKIAIEKASVNVAYDLEEESVVKLGNIPQELQGDGVNLALNPEIRIKLKTNFGAPLAATFKFVPYIKGKAIEDCTVIAENIEMPVSTDAADTTSKVYVISANPATSGPDELPVVCDLSRLVKRIPDEIHLYVHAYIDESKECVIFPSAKYVCKMDYDFNVPLSFSEDMSLSMNTLIDVDASVGDLLKYGSMRLNLDIVNTLPLGICCDVSLVDDKGGEIVLKQPLVLDIKPGDGNTPTVQSFHPELALKDMTNIPVLKQFRLSFSASATAGVAVAGDQFLQISGLSACLPEGVTIKSEKK